MRITIIFLPLIAICLAGGGPPAKTTSCHDMIESIRHGMDGMTASQQRQYLADDAWSFDHHDRALFDWSVCSAADRATEFAGTADHSTMLAEVAGNSPPPRYDIDRWCRTHAPNGTDHCINVQQGHYDTVKLLWRDASDYARLACLQHGRKTVFDQNYASLHECLSQWSYRESQWRQYRPSKGFRY